MYSNNLEGRQGSDLIQYSVPWEYELTNKQTIGQHRWSTSKHYEVATPLTRGGMGNGENRLVRSMGKHSDVKAPYVCSSCKR